MIRPPKGQVKLVSGNSHNFVDNEVQENNEADVDCRIYHKITNKVQYCKAIPERILTVEI